MRSRRHGTLELTLWCIVFLITAIFQFWRHVPEDGVMFVIALIALISVWYRTRNHEVHQRPRSKAMNRSIFLWSSIAVLTAIWELASYIIGDQTGRDYATPTISMLVAPFIAHPLGLIIFLIAWLATGVAIIRNPRFDSVSLLSKIMKRMGLAHSEAGE